MTCSDELYINTSLRRPIDSSLLRHIKYDASTFGLMRVSRVYICHGPVHLIVTLSVPTPLTTKLVLRYFFKERKRVQAFHGATAWNARQPMTVLHRGSAKRPTDVTGSRNVRLLNLLFIVTTGVHQQIKRRVIK